MISMHAAGAVAAGGGFSTPDAFAAEIRHIAAAVRSAHNGAPHYTQACAAASALEDQVNRNVISDSTIALWRAQIIVTATMVR